MDFTFVYHNQKHRCHILLNYFKNDHHYVLFLDENNDDQVISARIDDEGHLFPLNDAEMTSLNEVFHDYLRQSDQLTDHCQNCICQDGNCTISCEECHWSHAVHNNVL